MGQTTCFLVQILRLESESLLIPFYHESNPFYFLFSFHSHCARDRPFRLELEIRFARGQTFRVRTNVCIRFALLFRSILLYFVQCLFICLPARLPFCVCVCECECELFAFVPILGLPAPYAHYASTGYCSPYKSPTLETHTPSDGNSPLSALSRAVAVCS